MKYEHAEAFNLMQYKDQVTGEIEILWNSRDGVTPFIITSRAGNEAQHVNWREDIRAPNHIPKPGQRIFVDASPKHAHIRESAQEYVDDYWDKSVGGNSTMQETFEGKTKEEMVEFFIAEWTKPGTPTVMEADPNHAPETLPRPSGRTA